MVIAQKDGFIFVTLSDGEFLPDNLNSDKVVVFRQGDSTNRQLKIVKELGKLAGPDLLKPAGEPVCNYSGDGNPLHEHTDGSWWFYDETWAYENGPYENYDLGWIGLEAYCTELQHGRISLTEVETCDKVVECEASKTDAVELRDSGDVA